MGILNIIFPTEANFIALNGWLSQWCQFEFWAPKQVFQNPPPDIVVATNHPSAGPGHAPPLGGDHSVLSWGSLLVPLSHLTVLQQNYALSTVIVNGQKLTTDRNPRTLFLWDKKFTKQFICCSLIRLSHSPHIYIQLLVPKALLFQLFTFYLHIILAAATILCSQWINIAQVSFPFWSH